jgi:nicotinate-nucleotide--dimethylbenzimidazole phosphoribosyltransferase
MTSSISASAIALGERARDRTIVPADSASRTLALKRLDTLTKPLASLGRLEALAAQLCAIQRTVSPRLSAPHALVFAGDHGIARRGVSAYPPAVTAQMVANFIRGGAAISVLSRREGFSLTVVDAGVDAHLAPDPHLVDAKVRRGTRDFGFEAAMTGAECREARARAERFVDEVAARGSNTLILGEMGIGNTASASVLMHGLTGLPLSDCVGRGTGLDDRGLARKLELLTAACARCPPPPEPLDLLQEFGGYEIAMLVGAVCAAARQRMIVLVDGFTVTVAVLLASRLAPALLDYCVFGHCSAERAHRALLEIMGVKPVLDLDMRLGEGSGTAVALSVLRAALVLYSNMATFEQAGVSERVG